MSIQEINKFFENLGYEKSSQEGEVFEIFEKLINPNEDIYVSFERRIGANIPRWNLVVCDRYRQNEMLLKEGVDMQWISSFHRLINAGTYNPF